MYKLKWRMEILFSNFDIYVQIKLPWILKLHNLLKTINRKFEGSENRLRNIQNYFIILIGQKICEMKALRALSRELWVFWNCKDGIPLRKWKLQLKTATKNHPNSEIPSNLFLSAIRMSFPKIFMILSFLNSDKVRITFSVVIPMYSAISRRETGNSNSSL